MEENKVENVINIIKDMNIKDKLRLGICLTTSFTPWKKFEVFPYIMLRNRFQTTLLSMLEKHFGNKKFKALKNHIYKTSSNGFYVHAPKVKHRNIKSTVKYVIRYSGKPVDMMDPGDPIYPPMFDCEKCSGLMKPVYFIGYTGIEYSYDGN